MTAHAGIQWKGTSVCLDFVCVCGFESHLDAWGAYAIQCAACARIYEMPRSLDLTPVETTEWATVVVDAIPF